MTVTPWRSAASGKGDTRFAWTLRAARRQLRLVGRQFKAKGALHDSMITAGAFEADDAEVLGTDLLHTGWSTPRGLPTEVGVRRRQERFWEQRVVVMERASSKTDRAHPILAAGAWELEFLM